MASLWRPVRGLFVKELEVNRFLFQFFHEFDIQRVIDGSPWTFNRSPLLIERLLEGENPRTKKIYALAIWVQVYDLRPGFFSTRILEVCGNFIGSFLSSFPSNFTGIWREFLRFRVVLDTEKPLIRRLKFSGANGEFFWVNFKYERLPIFRFYCGMLGHGEKFCSMFLDEPNMAAERFFGDFMRAPDRRIQKQAGARWLRDGMAKPFLEDSEIGSLQQQDSPSDGKGQSTMEVESAVIPDQDLTMHTMMLPQNTQQVIISQGQNLGEFTIGKDGASSTQGIQEVIPVTDMKRRRILSSFEQDQVIQELESCTGSDSDMVIVRQSQDPEDVDHYGLPTYMGDGHNSCSRVRVSADRRSFEKAEKVSTDGSDFSEDRTDSLVRTRLSQ